MTNFPLPVAKLASVIAVAATLGACAVVPQTPEQATVARAQQRWDAILKKDFAAAYDYLAPETRQTITRENYAEATRGTLAYKIQAVRAHCESAECRVVVSFTAKIKMRGFPPEVTTTAEELWVRDQGQWWYKP